MICSYCKREHLHLTDVVCSYKKPTLLPWEKEPVVTEVFIMSDFTNCHEPVPIEEILLSKEDVAAEAFLRTFKDYVMGRLSRRTTAQSDFFPGTSRE